MHHRDGQKLQQVGWLQTLGEGQLALLKSDGMEYFRVVGLLQDGGNGQLGGVSE